MRGSSSPEGVPPARRNVNTIGSTIKNSSSEELAKRMIASFQAMAKIFFISNFPRAERSDECFLRSVVEARIANANALRLRATPSAQGGISTFAQSRFG